jgi:hypothetical protein
MRISKSGLVWIIVVLALLAVAREIVARNRAAMSPDSPAAATGFAH